MKPVNHVVVLQAAFARLITDRAIDGMIDQQELEHAAHCFLDSLIVRAHHHAVVHNRRASRRELWHLLDIDETHSAVAIDGKIGMIAIVRDLYAVIVGSLDDSLPRPGFDFLFVKSELRHRCF